MNFKEILELIDKVAERGIGSIEIEQHGTKVKIEGKSSKPVFSYVSDVKPSESSHPPLQMSALPPAAHEPQKLEEKKAPEIDASLHVITSPIVGTYYRAANPEAQPFVNVGDKISKGKVLCIIEAMKLMNEIESDVDGVITAIYPQNGQPVEYGEKLFAVKV